MGGRKYSGLDGHWDPGNESMINYLVVFCDSQGLVMLQRLTELLMGQRDSWSSGSGGLSGCLWLSNDHILSCRL